MTHIESKPGVMMGKPVIAGTRITVENILERLGAGEGRVGLQRIERARRTNGSGVHSVVAWRSADPAKATGDKLMI